MTKDQAESLIEKLSKSFMAQWFLLNPDSIDGIAHFEVMFGDNRIIIQTKSPEQKEKVYINYKLYGQSIHSYNGIAKDSILKVLAEKRHELIEAAQQHNDHLLDRLLKNL